MEEEAVASMALSSSNYFLSSRRLERGEVMKMQKKEKTKTKVEIDRELADTLKSMMKVGDTYSDVIRRLLEKE